MKEDNDPLHSVLHEWKAPELDEGLDDRVVMDFRARHRPSLWRRLWTTCVSIPFPVLAALLVMAAVIWLQFRSGPAAPPPPTATVAPSDGGYLSRLESTGFQPLPDGAARVIRKETAK